MKRTTLFRLLAMLCGLALIAAACGDDDDSGDESTDDPTTDETSAPDGECEVDDADGDYDWANKCRRQAVSMAIDRQGIVDAIFLGARAPGDDFWPGTLQGYRGDCDNLEYNPERAAELWEAAGGTKDGADFTLWFNTGGGHEEWTEAAANMLKQNLGIPEIDFEGLEFADYLDKLDAAEIDGPFRLGWLADYPSPGNFLGPLHQTAGSSNHTGYSNEEVDALITAGDSKPLEEAVADYQAAGDILCEDMPLLPMFFGLNQVVWSENVDNVSHDAFQRLVLGDVTDVDGDGSISVYICEPQNRLFGQDSNETCGSEALNALFTGLYSVDSSGEITFDGVAESIETSDEGTTWQIKLKDGWTFHDGTPVTASSFVDAWNWAANASNAAQNNYFFSVPGFQGYSDLNPPDEDGDGEPDGEPTADAMSGVVATDDLTIDITLDGPFAQLPLLLGYDAFNPLPESFYDDPDAFGEAPIGNGPFMMDPAVNGGAWEHDVQIATTAYPDYAGDAPSVEKVVYQIYSELDVAYAEAQANNLDVVDSVPPANLGTFKDEFADRFLEEPTSSFNYLGFPIDLELAASWHA